MTIFFDYYIVYVIMKARKLIWKLPKIIKTGVF